MKTKSNLAYLSLKFVLIDLIGDFLYWPVWWYTKGLYKAALFCLKEIKNWEEIIGLRIWAKNIFTPMFGQYDWEGRIISFFVRLIQIIFRTVILLIFIVLMIAIFIAWIILPIYIGYQFYTNLIWFLNYGV